MHETHHPATLHASDLPTERRALLAGIGGLAAGALLAGKAYAGPLNPPPGPIAPTPGPEPRIPINAQTTPGDANNLYRITQPGSYYLTGNIQTNLQTAIRIQAPAVCIDLNGFALIGGPGNNAILGTIDAPGVRIRNGTIRGWIGSGIRLDCPDGAIHLIEDIVAEACSFSGIIASGPAQVRRCSAYNCSSNGIRVARHSTLADCSAIGCNGSGFSLGDASTIERCLAAGNNLLGIDAAFGCFVRHCLVRDNSSIGILARGGSTVEHCNATLNGQDGIYLGGDGTARFNDCAANGRVSIRGGITCDSQDNRVEHNNCTNNGIGIRITGTGNLIIGNSCSGSVVSNYSMSAGNRYGPIIDLTAGGTPGVSGNSAPDTTGTAHPWANFSY